MITHRRVLLSEEASKHLIEAGECWMIAGKSSEQPGRVVIHMMPLEKGLADKLCEIAMGIRKPGRRIITPAIATDALTAMQDGKNGHPDLHPFDIGGTSAGLCTWEDRAMLDEVRSDQ